MAKEIHVICDSCGKEVYKDTYYTLKPRKYTGGKGTLYPTIWLCPACFRKTKLAMLLLDLGEGEV